MTSPDRSRRRDALAGVERLIVDGSNVLGVLANGAAAGSAPPATVIGRIRGSVPAEVRIELVFDGPAAGSPFGRVAEGMAVRFSGRRSGDAMIIDLASTAALSGHPPGSNVLVVTDDGALSAQVRRHGVRTVGTGWLLARIEHPGRRHGGGGLAHRPRVSALDPGTGPGATTPPPPGRDDARDEQAAADRSRWRPGRGATAKTGTARKAPRTAKSIEGRPWKRRRGSSG